MEPPLKVSVVFVNHTELFLSVPSILKIATAHQRQSFMAKNKMLKNEKLEGKINLVG